MSDLTHREAFGSRLRETRSARGLSQEDMANAAGLDRSYVGGVERGQRNVSLDNIYKLASALGVDPSELFRGDAQKVKPLRNPSDDA